MNRLSERNLTPYTMKSVKERQLSFIVSIVDERNVSFCKGYKVTVEKNSGEILGKENINYCN